MTRLLSLLLILISAPCQAETVTFRSGEHADFSRLVLDIPAGADWNLSSEEGGYLLRMDPVHDFDTSAAFDRIPRDRLAALATDRGAGLLWLELACDCHASAFLFRPDKLVIDIVDGPPPDSAAAAPDAPPDDPTSPILPAFPVVPDALIASPGLTSLAALPSGLAPAMPDPFLTPLERAAVDAPRVGAAEQALIESLSRASAQGIVNFQVPDFTPPQPVPEQDDAMPISPDGMVAASDQMTETSIAAPASVPGLAIESALDRGSRAQTPLPATRLGGDCLDAALFDFASWGDGRPFHAQLADRTAALTGEFDIFTEGAVESLARTYMHFGFGREARQALQLDGRRSPEREIMASVAAVIDGDAPESEILSRQAGCPGPVSLWSALARRSIAGTSEAERTAMMTAHRLLPTALRQQIGPRLADLFLKAGDPAGAAEILAPRIDAFAQDPVQAGLAEAEIARQSLGTVPALDRLTAMVDDGGRLTAATMADLLDLSVADGRRVDNATLELASAIRFEARGTEDAVRLALAEVRAYIAADQWDAAKAILADEATGIPEETRKAIGGELIVAMTDRMGDADFLQIAFDVPIPDLTARAANAIAARLIALGFAQEAERFLRRPALDDDMVERRFLRAEAAIALDRAGDARAALAGMSGPRAEAILTRIVAPGPDANPDAGGTSGNLPEAARSATPQAGQPVNSGIPVSGQGPPGRDSSGETLAARRLILEEAARARALAEQTLASRSGE